MSVQAGIAPASARAEVRGADRASPRRHRRRPHGRQERQQAPQLPHPAGPAAALPDRVLARIFSYLMIGDLMSCTQVSGRWRRVALCPVLQTRCLRQTYPWEHRQQMQQALDAGGVRPRIAPWCRPPAPEAAAVGAPSPEALLSTAVQRLLLTKTFYPPQIEHRIQRGFDILDLVCSPDGRWLALSTAVPGNDRAVSIQLQFNSLAGPCIVHEVNRHRAVCQLRFGADSRSLWVLYRTGQEEVWRLDNEGGWIVPAAPGFLCPGRVLKAQFSGDGRLLAVVLRNSLRLYSLDGPEGEGRPAGWQKLWPEDEEFFLGVDPASLILQFSDDCLHCVFAVGRFVCICSWNGRCWQEQVIESADPVRGQVAFDIHSRLLVLASSPDATGGRPVEVSIRRWRFAQERGWTEVPDHGARGPGWFKGLAHPRAGYYIPVGFSPDGSLAVLPSRENCRDLRLLPVTGPDAWQRAMKFAGGYADDRIEDGAPVLISGFGFSSNSQFLVVLTSGTLYLWKRLAGLRWIKAGSISHPGQQGIQLALSPDGYHCALSRGRQVSLWHMARSFTQGSKLQFPYGPRVRQEATPSKNGIYAKSLDESGSPRVQKLLFTPDGTRLLMVTLGQIRAMGDKRVEASVYSSLHMLSLAPGQAADLVPNPPAP